MIENAKDIQYHHFNGTTTTVCVVTLSNDFSIVGSSDCVSVDDFDPIIGMDEAVKDASRQLWAFEAYRRKSLELCAGDESIDD